MPCPGELERAGAEIQARGYQSEIKNRTAQTANHETIEMLHHRGERDASLDLGHRFGVNAIGNESGTDAVSRDVADHQVERMGARRDETEVSADGAHRLV